jgi:uncharacterized protein with HEPN domain
MIEQFTMGMSFEDFRADPKTVAAVERKLQTISEAAIRLGPGAESNWPELPWREIRGIGNWRRHQCERIEFPLLWNTVEQDLPRLKGVALRVLAWNPG